jgi:hypothetical protein
MSDRGSAVRRGVLVVASLLALPGLACGSSSDGAAGSESAGICVGNGWRDTCHWLSSCSGGQFELLCSTNRDDTAALLADAGVTLYGETCACIARESTVVGVDYDDSFCSNQFESDDPDRFGKAKARVEAICGWRL